MTHGPIDVVAARALAFRPREVIPPHLVAAILRPGSGDGGKFCHLARVWNVHVGAVLLRGLCGVDLPARGITPVLDITGVPLCSRCASSDRVFPGELDKLRKSPAKSSAKAEAVVAVRKRRTPQYRRLTDVEVAQAHAVFVAAVAPVTPLPWVSGSLSTHARDVVVAAVIKAFRDGVTMVTIGRWCGKADSSIRKMIPDHVRRERRGDS
jgi:hypothetical protein